MKQLDKSTDLFGNEYFIPVMALTWKQPFASLMLHGKLETREWATRHRGKVLICSGLERYLDVTIEEMSGIETRKRIDSILLSEPTANARGKIIAVGDLVNCRPMVETDEEMAFVKYKPGLWVHEYKNVKRIVPIKFSGSQKWSEVSDQEFLSKIVYV